MTPIKIIGGLVACILMACGSVSKQIEPAAPVGIDSPAENTTVEPSTPAVVFSPTPSQLSPSLINSVPDAVKLPTLAEQILEASNRIGPYRTLDPTLCQAAQNYAEHLARTRQQGHFADGDPEYRARRAGFTGSLRAPGRLRSDGWTTYGLGEVLAFGTSDLDGAFEAWLDSPSHKAALLESTYDVAGFANVGTIWVGMFGNSQATSAPPPNLVYAAKPQPVRYSQPQQTYRTYGTCSGPGCGRRGIFGRR